MRVSEQSELPLGGQKNVERVLITTTDLGTGGQSGSPEFEVDIAHWTNSSSQKSACSVEPGTPQDVGVVVSPCTLYHRHLAMFLTPSLNTAAPASRIDTDTVRYQRWWTHPQPRILVYPRRANLIGKVQRHCYPRRLGDGRDWSRAYLDGSVLVHRPQGYQRCWWSIRSRWSFWIYPWRR